MHQSCVLLTEAAAKRDVPTSILDSAAAEQLVVQIHEQSDVLYDTWVKTNARLVEWDRQINDTKQVQVYCDTFCWSRTTLILIKSLCSLYKRFVSSHLFIRSFTHTIRPPRQRHSKYMSQPRWPRKQ